MPKKGRVAVSILGVYTLVTHVVSGVSSAQYTLIDSLGQGPKNPENKRGHSQGNAT